MRNTLLFLSLLLLCACNNAQQEKTTEPEGMTTFYFIRHAEKRTDQGDNPELTEQGKERAAQWVNFFFLKNVDAILASNYIRTQKTAEPLAASKKIKVITYDVKTLTAAQLLEKYRGKTVALIGHSNTINEYANQLQNDSIYKPLADDDYDHYFLVRVDESGKSSAVLEEMPFIND